MKAKIILIAFAAQLLFSCTPDPVHVSSITLNTKAISLEIGQTETLTATVSPKNADNQIVVWSSGNASIAKVQSDGKVTAMSPGLAHITAKTDDGGISEACAVTVPDPYIYVSGVTLNPESITLHEGEWAQLSASVTPAEANNPSLQWSSENTAVAQVTSSGVLLALEPGTTSVIVKTVEGGMSAKCEVTVKERVTGLKLEPEKQEMLVGDEMDITATLEPADANVKVLFSTTNTDVISVDSETGHVKALSAGYAVVCAATDYKGLVAFSKIRVRDRIQSVEVASPSKQANVGAVLNLTATVTPTQLPDIKLTWTSSNSSIASVNADGVLTTKARGTVTITATVENGPLDIRQGSCEILVLQPVTSIKVSPTFMEIFEGDEINIKDNFTVEIAPSDADDSSWTAHPDKENIVSVKDGKIKAEKDGSVTLHFTPSNPASQDVKADVAITVHARVSGITIYDNKPIKVGETLQLRAKVAPDNANQSVKWESSKPEIATVDQKGLVTANKTKSGSTTITVSSIENPDIKKTCEVSVEDIPITSFELSPTFLALMEGESATLKVAITPENTNLDKGVNWSSGNVNVATVTADGIVTAISKGETTITATSKGDATKVKYCSVVVSPASYSVTGVSLNKNSLELEVGKSETLTATVAPANATNKEVTWSSSNSSVASVNASGVVTALAVGTATITVTTQDGGKTDTCVVTVPEPPVAVSSIALSQTSATLTFGKSLDVNVTILPTNATNPAWECSSSNTSIASVAKTTSGASITAGNTAGTATITFTSTQNPKVTATFQVTVKAQIIPVSQIVISPGALELYLGQTKQVTATVYPDNADNKTVIWSVPQGGNVTVDQQGNVTGVVEGKRRLIASSADGAAEASIWVTVKKNAVVSVTLPTDKLTLKAGETYDLKATVNAEDPSFPATNSKVTWTSSSTSIATVNSGKITAVCAGTTIITVTTNEGSKKASCTVTVLSAGNGNGESEGIGFDDWTFE